MRKKHTACIVAAMVCIGLTGGLLTGCSSGSTPATGNPGSVQTASEEGGGAILLKVNPEIEIFYDADGLVTKIEGENDDGRSVIADYKGYTGKSCRDVVRELVTRIHDAGYFVEETEGEARKITLELEKGSVLPEKDFLNSIAADVESYTAAEHLNSPVNVYDDDDWDDDRDDRDDWDDDRDDWDDWDDDQDDDRDDDLDDDRDDDLDDDRDDDLDDDRDDDLDD